MAYDSCPWQPDLAPILVHADTIPVSAADRAEWLKARTKGLGGSDAGTVVGVDKYTSAFRLWLEKTGQVEPENLDDKEVVYWGTTLEGVVRSEFEKRAGVPVWQPDCMFRSKQRPWQLASLDGLTLAPDNGELAIVEFKTAGFFLADEWEDDKIPPKYEAQGHHYAAVTGLRRVFVACLIAGQRFVWKEMPVDEELIVDLCEAERRFWENHVVANMPPPVDDSEDCATVLRSMWDDLADTTTVDVSVRDEAVGYLAAREEAKAAKKRKDLAGNRLRAALGAFEVGVFDGEQVATNRRSETEVTDWKAVVEELAFGSDTPLKDLIEKHTSTRVTRTLRVNNKLLKENDG